MIQRCIAHAYMMYMQSLNWSKKSCCQLVVVVYFPWAVFLMLGEKSHQQKPVGRGTVQLQDTLSRTSVWEVLVKGRPFSSICLRILRLMKGHLRYILGLILNMGRLFWDTNHLKLIVQDWWFSSTNTTLVLHSEGKQHKISALLNTSIRIGVCVMTSEWNHTYIHTENIDTVLANVIVYRLQDTI